MLHVAFVAQQLEVALRSNKIWTLIHGDDVVKLQLPVVHLPAALLAA